MTSPNRGGARGSSWRSGRPSPSRPILTLLGGWLLWAGPAPGSAQQAPSASPATPGAAAMALEPLSSAGTATRADPDRPRPDGLAPPVPLPMRADPGSQVVGPLPVAAVVPLPALSHDHHGDGAGTVGAGLIWMGQLPRPYHGSRYHDGDGKVGGPVPHMTRITPHSKTVNTNGTLGYGPPGLHPGFYGFGLSFHPGYGYGGNALGVGAYGGEPCYGGPGYPLRYGYPKFAQPHYEGIGQLYYDQPVTTTDRDGAGDFGAFTGASDYAYTHPSYAAEAASAGSFMPGVASFPNSSASNPSPDAVPPGGGAMNRGAMRDRFLGMAVDAVVEASGRKGLSVVSVLPGSTAENAGLRVGDVIVSIDGRPTEQRGDLGRIVAGVAPGGTLKMIVSRAGTGPEQAVTLRVP